MLSGIHHSEHRVKRACFASFGTSNAAIFQAISWKQSRYKYLKSYLSWQVVFCYYGVSLLESDRLQWISLDSNEIYGFRLRNLRIQILNFIENCGFRFRNMPISLKSEDSGFEIGGFYQNRIPVKFANKCISDLGLLINERPII